MRDELLNSIPALDTLESRFSFITNETLRQNVTIYFRHIIFLLALSEDAGINTLKYTLYKDIIIFTASIVESILQYTVEKYIVEGKASRDIFGFSTKRVNVANIKHDCDDLYRSSLVVERKSKIPKYESGDELTFNDINKAALKAKILTDSLFKKADTLREMRNTIHLQSLTKSSDDYFNKSDVENAFKNAGAIILEVETLLKAITATT